VSTLYCNGCRRYRPDEAFSFRADTPKRRHREYRCAECKIGQRQGPKPKRPVWVPAVGEIVETRWIPAEEAAVVSVDAKHGSARVYVQGFGVLPCGLKELKRIAA
jgi:hypothetical protein